MPELYLSRLETVFDPLADNYWRAPGGDALGMLDIRTLPEMGEAPGTAPSGYALVLYDGPRNYPELVRHLGNQLDSQMDSRNLNMLKSLTGLPLGETRIDRVLREVLLAHGDPTGINRHGACRAANLERLDRVPDAAGRR